MWDKLKGDNNMQDFRDYKIIVDLPSSRLLKFNNGKGTPIFVVPPHAGRHGNIAQRLIDTCVKENRTVYAFELKSATCGTKDTSIDMLITLLRYYVNVIGGEVELIGLCQGAWLGAIFTALYPNRVTKYANFAGPIDTSVGEGNKIVEYMKTYGVYEYHKQIVENNGGIQYGYLQWMSFAMVRPEEILFQRWFDLYNMAWKGDTEGIKKWKRNNGWYDTPLNLAGTWFLQCLKHHFRDNKLYNGKWVVHGRKVNLADITCPVYLFAGDADDITHYDQVFNMANKVQGSKYKILFRDAGHTKVFVGTNELNTFKQIFLN
jgi:poly(3-hydroxyalkanoate) synthetase